MTDASKSGKFDLFYRKGWACLRVFPPAHGGRQVYSEDVENRMKLLGIPRVSARTIRDIIDAATGQAVPLVEWPQGQLLEAAISVDIAEDEMTAYLTIQPPKKGAEPPTLQDIEQQLNNAGVVYGIDRQALKRILAGALYGKPVPVAAGIEPVFGRAHRIQYHFNTNRGKPYLEMDFGRINLKELNFIENCTAEDLLAELIPPVTAVDGRKVTGEVIPADTDSEIVTLHPGANTVLSEDGSRLYAACDGNVRLSNGAVLVEPVIVLKNVDYETGNIHFDGSVVIEGGIADGFAVEAGGDLQVANSVGRATLQAGGSILLKSGINGNGKGVISCGGDLFARYIESCSITCSGNIFAEEVIMHSQLNVSGHCVLNGKRAEVIASELIIGCSFWCKKLGNFNEAATRVCVGIAPGILLELRAVTAEIEQAQIERDSIELKLEQLVKHPAASQGEERLEHAIAQLQESLAELGIKLSGLRIRQGSLREKMKASRESLVVVEDTLFKGSTVFFADLEYRPPEAGIRKIILRAVENHILEHAFNPTDRPKLNFGAEYI